jgi:hypothetical protein
MKLLDLVVWFLFILGYLEWVILSELIVKCVIGLCVSLNYFFHANAVAWFHHLNLILLVILNEVREINQETALTKILILIILFSEFLKF